MKNKNEKKNKKIIKKIGIEEEIIYFYNRISCFWKSDEEYYRRAYRKRNIYNINWELAHFQMGEDKNTEEKIVEPKNFEKMKEIAKKLSEDFDFVRVDLYNVNGKIKFGEITFTPAMGLDQLPKEWDLYLGSL